ncbi:MAG: phosphatidylserine/phosphatidylglycerophosphate/cardiolipin synthase family protein [Nannocystaceae bacterium]
MAQSKPGDLTAFLRQKLGELGRDDDGEALEGGSLIERAASALGATLDRWSRAPGLSRLFGSVDRDLLTGPGEWVELTAQSGVGVKGSLGRFTLDGEVVAERPLAGEDEWSAVIRAPAAGLYRIDAAIVDPKSGRETPLLGRRLLQVASARPVALVDVAPLLASRARRDEDAAVLELPRALQAGGFDIAYFDIHEKNRDATIHEALVDRGLPDAATLIFAAEDNELRTLGVDFSKLFGVTATRRLRARGVPVTLVVSERLAGADADALPVLSPSEALVRLGRGELADHGERAARIFVGRSADAPGSWRLDQATGSRRVAGNELRVELDNASARARLFELIEAATTSIHLQFYIMRPSSFAEELVVRLIARARAGVRVRVMVDALYSDQEVLGRENPLVTSLTAEPRIDVRAIRPIEAARGVEVARLKKRDHRKLVIVDGARAIVSGRNASSEYYRGFDEIPIHDQTRHERIPWLDAHVEIAGPLVEEVDRCFRATWQAEGGDPIEEAPRVAAAGPSAGRLVIHQGLRDANSMAMYEAMLDLAEERVIIVNDFPIVSAIGRAIRRVLRRGARVLLLTGCAATRRDDGSFFPAPVHRTVFEYMVKARLEPLLAAGVEIFEYVAPRGPRIVARGGRVRPYVHAKVMTVDGKLASVGSANLDATASFWESEANVVIEDPQVVAQLEGALMEMIDRSLAIDRTSEYWRREAAQRAVVAKLWPGALYS